MTIMKDVDTNFTSIRSAFQNMYYIYRMVFLTLFVAFCFSLHSVYLA